MIHRKIPNDLTMARDWHYAHVVDVQARRVNVYYPPWQLGMKHLMQRQHPKYQRSSRSCSSEESFLDQAAPLNGH